jgi:NADPH:quinone reductase-like Zn-dependent oxidoreductase
VSATGVSDGARDSPRADGEVLDRLPSGELKPIIAKTFPFEKIVKAHWFMESNEQIDKIIVIVE